MRTNASARGGDEDGAGVKFNLVCFFLIDVLGAMMNVEVERCHIVDTDADEVKRSDAQVSSKSRQLSCQPYLCALGLCLF